MATMPDDEDLDPRIKDYLMQRFQQGKAMQAPEYQASLRQDASDARDLKSGNNMAALLANSMSMAGQVNGKRADSSGMDRFAQAQNQDIDSNYAMNKGLQDEQDKQFGINGKVADFLLGQQQAKQMKQAQMSQALQAHQDQQAQMTENRKSRETVAAGNQDIKRMMAQGVVDSRDKKNADASDKTYSEMIGKMETPRGNQSVQQAQNALRNIGNAEELMNMYPDLNKMPSQQVNLLYTELAKIASGGVGSEHGQKSLEANTFKQNFNNFLSKAENEPTGADLGAFLQQNKTYLQGLKSNNQKAVTDYKTKIYNGYKNRLTDDQQKQFKEEYSDLFKPQETPKPPPVPGGPGQALSAPAPNYKVGDTKNIGGKNYVRTAQGWEEQE